MTNCVRYILKHEYIIQTRITCVKYPLLYAQITNLAGGVLLKRLKFFEEYFVESSLVYAHKFS